LICLFLRSLIQEKNLYTKIELCDALSKGGIQSAKIMVKYLGQIVREFIYHIGEWVADYKQIRIMGIKE